MSLLAPFTSVKFLHTERPSARDKKHHSQLARLVGYSSNMELDKWNIYEWLEKAGMSQYAESFVDNGYDTPDLCAELQDDDLSAIGVNDKRHRTVLFTKARKLMDLLKGGEGTDGPIKLQAAPVSPIVVATCPSNGQYSEPWQPWSGRGTSGGGGGGQTNGGTRVKMARSGSGEKPPLPPPNKPKKRHPPPSPLATELPTFKREGGETGLTKLQLQLKIREELRAEGVVLSEPPYVNEVCACACRFVLYWPSLVVALALE